ncbi:inositol-trisphosphate 3-kinase B-like [Harmonia axyridis]|uniref:inositol-trisphosphate 3-kinase B-like n=1 Tax=Harmonia axyridis TaxID=115357 RepID=UPI001E2761C0|nr:inositol-trisphosphate 3-kinase B-like [Harmonia axyridis]
MACFSAFFWPRREEDNDVLTSSDNTPWFISGVDPRRILPPTQVISTQIHVSYKPKSMCNDLLSNFKFLSCDMGFEVDPSLCNAVLTDMSVPQTMREVESFNSTCENDVDSSVSGSTRGNQVAQKDLNLYGSSDIVTSREEENPASKNPDRLGKRYRRTGVYGIPNNPQNDEDIDGALEDKKQILNKIEPKNDNLLIPPASGYWSSITFAGSDDEFDKFGTFTRNQVGRCESSDSEILYSDEQSSTLYSNWGEKKEEIDDLPYEYPVFSPYSPRRSIDHDNVPSKTLLEAQFVALPFDRKPSDAFSELSEQFTDDSRRQSCFTDDGDEVAKYRYWRTPSVVVSDYSDDPMGLTLEDMENIRIKYKENSSSAESSLCSSYSNLNLYESNSETYRKMSDCSTCSFKGDDDDDCFKEPSPWRKIRNFVQWTPFFQTYKKQRYPWVQLAGHQGNFKAGPDQGTILKKLCIKEEKCFKVLMDDVLKPFVPEYKGLVTSDDGECSYIQLQDLLSDFVSPCVMDCKIGVRTYLEEELAKAKEKPKLRKDMYEKMCQIDNSAPTDEEHKMKGVTKPRYMVWRETISSTATLGFRIEGIRKSDGTSSKDFKTVKSREQVMKEFIEFTENFPHAVPKYIQRLTSIKATLETSPFFQTHEVIGSSLLFVHDKYNANVWLIDFAKTLKLPDNITITHKEKWKVGNHEDGYLIGVDNLISIFKSILENYPVPVSPPLSLPDSLDIGTKEEKTENT